MHCLPNHPALTLTAHGTRSNPEIITLEVLLFFYLWLISCIESEDLIPFPTHVICTNVHNNIWLLMLSLGNVLQSLRHPVSREATDHSGVPFTATQSPVCPSNERVSYHHCPTRLHPSSLCLRPQLGNIDLTVVVALPKMAILPPT